MAPEKIKIASAEMIHQICMEKFWFTAELFFSSLQVSWKAAENGLSE